MYQERDSILSSNKEKETLFKELQQLLFLLMLSCDAKEPPIDKRDVFPALLRAFLLNNTISFFPSKDNYNRVSVTAKAKSFLFYQESNDGDKL